MDNWQLQHRRSLAFDEQRHQDVASIGKFDRVVMAMWHIWFGHTKLGNAEAGCSRPDPSLVVLNVLLEGSIGSGQQADSHTRIAFCSKATGPGPAARCGHERLSNIRGTPCNGLQPIV